MSNVTEEASIYVRISTTTVLLALVVCGLACYLVVLYALCRFRHSDFSNPFYRLALVLGILDCNCIVVYSGLFMAFSLKYHIV